MGQGHGLVLKVTHTKANGKKGIQMDLGFT